MPLATICLSLLLVVDDSIASMTMWKGLHLLLHITGLRSRQCKGFVWNAEGHYKYSTKREREREEKKTTNIVTSIYIPIILC